MYIGVFWGNVLSARTLFEIQPFIANFVLLVFVSFAFQVSVTKYPHLKASEQSWTFDL